MEITGEPLGYLSYNEDHLRNEQACGVTIILASEALGDNFSLVMYSHSFH